jgi:hypothetical protein
MNNNVESDLEEELYEHFKKYPKGKRLAIDKYLMGLIQNATRNIQIAATEGNIL